jgi:hypothetical protein
MQGENVNVIITEGTLTMLNSALVSADLDAAVQITVGDLIMSENAAINAGRDVLAEVVGNIDLGGTTSVTAGRTIGWVADNAILMQGTTTLSAETGDLLLVSDVTGEITLSGTSTLMSGGGMLIDVKHGDLTVFDNTKMLADQGDLQIMLRDGLLTATGTTEMAGDGVTIELQTMDHSVSLSGATSIIADQSDLGIHLVQGDISMTGETTLTAKSDVNAIIDYVGDISVDGTTVITATDDNIMLETETGDMSFSDKTTITSGTDTLLLISAGDLRMEAATTVMVGNDIRATLLDGFFGYGDRTILEADRNVVIEARNGLAGSELSAMQGENVNVIITEGTLTMLNSALVSADLDAAVQITVGDLLMSENAAVNAGDDITVNVDHGTVQMRADTLISAADDLTMQVGAGYLWMQDAETLIRAEDVKVTVEKGINPREGSIWLDRIEGDQSVWLQAIDGRILDNTAARDEDLIVTFVMSLEASDGIGLTWEDNLNTDADYFSGFNSRSGGINVQNRTALAIGVGDILLDAPKGLVNYGDDDIVLVSPGLITHGHAYYGMGDRFDDGTITNKFGQSIFIVHNLGQPLFREQQGDTTRARMSAQFSAPKNLLQETQKKQVELERRMRKIGDVGDADQITAMNRFDVEGDAFSKLAGRLNKLDHSEVTRSIRKSRELLNITFADGFAGDNQQQLDPTSSLNRENFMTDPDQNDVDLDAPLLPNIDELSADDSVVNDRIDQRPVLQSALELSDDDLDAPLIAAE